MRFLKERKKLNLLPIEVKEKYANKYMIYYIFSVAAILIFILGIQFTRIGITKLEINRIQTENARYETEEKNIEKLQKEIEGYKQFIDIYESNSYFPFVTFMNDLEKNRPSSVYIISIDSDDRLVNEGEQDETEKNNVVTNNKTNDSKSDNVKDNESEEDTTDETEAENREDEETEIIPQIKYESDLMGKQLTLRGYSKSQADISEFIYLISNLDYITNAAITGIEEHKMMDGQNYNIFEIRLTGGMM